MSTATATVTAPGSATPARPPAPRGEVTQLRVLHSEWIKLRTLRSTFWTLIGGDGRADRLRIAVLRGHRQPLAAHGAG